MSIYTLIILLLVQDKIQVDNGWEIYNLLHLHLDLNVYCESVLDWKSVKLDR